MFADLNFRNQSAIEAVLRTQTKLGRINVIAALTRAADQIVAILRAVTPGGPNGPVASAWQHDEPEIDGTRVAVRIFNDAMTEDGLWPIATLLEYGTTPHIIRAKNGKALAFPASKTSSAVGWDSPIMSGRGYADFEQRAQESFSPVTGRYRPSFRSPNRHGNFILFRGEYRPKVASDVRTGLGQYRLASGNLSRPAGAKDMVVVKEVHHPGTRPRFIVRNNLGRFEVIISENGRDALIALCQRRDLRVS